MHSYNVPTDHTVNTTESNVGDGIVANSAPKEAFFFVNKGSVDVTIKIYGSPINENNFNPGDNSGASPWTQAQLDLLYNKVIERTVSANDNLYVDVSPYVYSFYRIKASTASGSTTLNYFMMKSNYQT
jgi:hypothetical protein